MKSTAGMTIDPTAHALRTMIEKGFSAEVVKATFETPARVYPSGSHPGQYRVTGNGVCLVGKPEGDRFVLITVYQDQVLTPPREDQLDTPEGRRYAERYNNGLGRG
jgi:Domain of unknown function (DUF4258)